ncbi:unnamed protein product [Hymenolepis diminuta]|uniref:Uncharacterized protein n=1 Tax=Hymenolepis diminuta TaxID=6216 RepID=A0A564YTF9_HYMDI|nr:unnamed protein product [Hymenolepis diminuta]
MVESAVLASVMLSTISINFPKSLGQSNHIRPQLMSWALMDDRCYQLQHIGLANGTVSKNPIGSQTNAPCSLLTLIYLFLTPSHLPPIQSNSIDSYFRWPDVISFKSATTATTTTITTTINSLRQVEFVSQGVPKVIVSTSVTHFSSTSFQDFCHYLTISLPHSPPYLNGLDNRLAENVKRQLPLSYLPVRLSACLPACLPACLSLLLVETVEEIFHSLQFRYRTTHQIRLQMWMPYRKHPPSRYPVLTSKPKKGPIEIYLDACYSLSLRIPRPRRRSTIIGPIFYS